MARVLLMNDGFTMPEELFGDSIADDPIMLLCAEIVIAAVADWRKLVKRKAWNKPPLKECNFMELRVFFNGDWCAFIMQNFDLEPARILEILERELQQAMAGEENRKKKRVKFRSKKE